jgi:phage terminase large subunit-like protein
VLDIPRFTPEQISALSDEEAEKLLEALEALHREKRRESMTEYARFIEVPGTPSPLSQDDRIKLLRKKEAMRRRADNKGWEEPEDEELGEPEGGDVTFYPNTLEPAEHHDLIMDAIQALMEEEPVVGPLSNGHEGIIPEGVILMCPPGSAKSSYASVVAPSYIMGRWPGTDVIGLSYAADLARRFGRRVRAICRSERFGDTFVHKGAAVSVTADNQAVDQWSLTNGSNYRAVGILGGVTGNRADVVIIDDPIAGREEAESEVIRDKTNQAIKDDVLTRLKPFGKVILILTRWHEDDPAGHVLGEDWDGQSGLWQGKDGRWWLVLRLPLLADAKDDPLGRATGEKLWPEWFTDRHVELARGDPKSPGDERSWMSLYQQRPSASDGVILLRRYWRCWPHGRPEPDEAQLDDPSMTEPPRDWTQCFLVYDTAIEDGQDNDHSAMTAWAAFPSKVKKGVRRLDKRKEGSPQQNLLMIGSWRAKIAAVDLMRTVESHIEFFRPDHIVIEKKASGHQLIQELRRKRPRYTDLGQVHYVNVHAWEPPFPPGQNGKTPRAHNAALLFAEGSIWYMPGPNNILVIKECAAFPNGKYDDWVDTVTAALIWSRSMNLLEIPGDITSTDEDEQQHRDQREFEESGRSLYGAQRSGKAMSSAARSLYGRSGAKVSKFTGPLMDD